jgi:hypothetical protein
MTPETEKEHREEVIASGTIVAVSQSGVGLYLHSQMRLTYRGESDVISLQYHAKIPIINLQY